MIAFSSDAFSTSAFSVNAFALETAVVVVPVGPSISPGGAGRTPWRGYALREAWSEIDDETEDPLLAQLHVEDEIILSVLTAAVTSGALKWRKRRAGS